MWYECDLCGACCRHLIYEINELDLLREPRLIGKARPFKMPPGMVLLDDDGNPVAEAIPGYGAGATLNSPEPPHACVMQDGNLCSVYATRPACCVGFPPGCENCQSSRAAEGLPPLLANGRLSLPLLA